MTTQDSHSELLAELASRAGLASLPSPDEAVAQLAAGDPRLALVARLLAIRRSEEALKAAEEEAEDGADGEEPAHGPPAEPDASLVVRRLARALRRLRAELEPLRERNDALAAALGACYLCWGEDPGCPECQGHGTPGAAAPQREPFLRYVAPAVRVLRPSKTGPAAAPDRRARELDTPPAERSTT